MRVLAITPTFHPELGGLEQVVLELAKRVRAHGVDMDVAHVAKSLSSSTDDVEGVTVYRIGLLGNRFLGWAPGLSGLARGYDLLHVHDPQVLALSSNVRWQCGAIPSMLSTHGGFWHTRNNYLFKKFYEATLLRGYVGHYRRVLASSVGDFDYFKAFTRRIVLCSNGVPVKRFNDVVPAESRSVLKWIYWGRLSRNKRLDLVLDCLARVRDKGFAAELLVCGRDFDGLMPQLTAQVRSLKLEGAVRFEPYLDDAALRQELAGRGVYMSASEYEGFGLSIVEAMAAGLIVVCRDMAPLNTFFINGEAGLLLKFDGGGEDATALERLLRAPRPAALAMSAAARRSATIHDWDSVTPRFVQHYREVLESS